MKEKAMKKMEKLERQEAKLKGRIEFISKCGLCGTPIFIDRQIYRIQRKIRKIKREA